MAAWLAGLKVSLRNSLSGLLGLLSLIALSILVVWPLWYVATTHTRLYSLAIVLLAGGFIVYAIYAKVCHPRSKGRRR